MQATPSFNDPLQGHAAATQCGGSHSIRSPPSEPAHAEVVSVAAAAAGVDPALHWSSKGHSANKTRTFIATFARLLVDEIKLYDQAKVAEGRRRPV